MTTRYQTGSIYEAYGAFHIKYYTTVLRESKAVRASRSHKLCRKDAKHFSATCKAVKKLAADFMAGNLPPGSIPGPHGYACPCTTDDSSSPQLRNQTLPSLVIFRDVIDWQRRPRIRGYSQGLLTRKEKIVSLPNS